MHRSTSVVLSHWMTVFEETKRRSGIMFRAAQKWTKKFLGCAWAEWVEVEKDQKRRRNLERKATAMFSRSGLGKAWATWAHYKYDEQRLFRSAYKVVGKWQFQSAAHSLLRWQEEIVEANRLRKITVKVIMRWTRRCLSEAMYTWTDIVKAKSQSHYVKSSSTHTDTCLYTFENIQLLAYTTWKMHNLGKRKCTDCVANKWQQFVVTQSTESDGE